MTKLPPGITLRSGSYRASVMAGGKRHTKTFDIKHLRKAVNWIADVKSQHRNGTLVDTTGLKSHTVKSVLDYYVEKRLGSARGNLPAIYKASFIDMTLDKLRPSHIRAWKIDMENQVRIDPITEEEKHLSPATIVKRLNILSSCFNFAIRNMELDNFINVASSAYVERPRNADVRRTRRLKDGEWERLVESAKQSRWKDDYWLILFSVEQATRMSEALSLKWSDVNLDTKMLSLDHTKNEKHRTTDAAEIRPMTTGAVQVLRDKLATYDVPPKPTDKIFNCGSRAYVSGRFITITKRAKIDDFHFHDLRHEATSRLAERLEYHDLKHVTGHMDIKSLDRYNNPDLKRIADII